MGLFPVVATALARRDEDGRIGGRNSDTGGTGGRDSGTRGGDSGTRAGSGGTRVGNDGPPDATG